MAERLVAAAVVGIQTGCVYAVIALGLSIIFGIMRVVNFAHGSVLMIFMYLGYYLFFFLGIDPYLSMAITVPAGFGFGYAVQRLLVKPLFVREKSYVVEPLGVLSAHGWFRHGAY